MGRAGRINLVFSIDSIVCVSQSSSCVRSRIMPVIETLIDRDCHSRRSSCVRCARSHPPKQVTASHCFESALDLTMCVRDTQGKDPAGIYLITLKGSQQAGLTGFKEASSAKSRSIRLAPLWRRPLLRPSRMWKLKPSRTDRMVATRVKGHITGERIRLATGLAREFPP
jgi:hypothetical protein